MFICYFTSHDLLIYLDISLMIVTSYCLCMSSLAYCVMCKATLRDKRKFVQGFEKGVKTYSPTPPPSRYALSNLTSFVYFQDQCEHLSPKDLKLANVKEDHINTILVLNYDILHECDTRVIKMSLNKYYNIQKNQRYKFDL